MESRALLAIVLSMAVLALYQYYFVPPVDESSLQQQDAAAAPQTRDPVIDENVAAPQEAVLPEATRAADGSVEAVSAQQQETLRIHAENYTASVTNVGGRLQGFVLNQYQSAARTPLELVHPAAAAADALPFGIETPSNPRHRGGGEQCPVRA